MTYSEMAIQCALTLREVFKLTLRATQGFLLSLIQLLNNHPLKRVGSNNGLKVRIRVD